MNKLISCLSARAKRMVDPVSLSMALFAALLAVVGQMLLKVAMSKVDIIGSVALKNPSELIWLNLV